MTVVIVRADVHLKFPSPCGEKVGINLLELLELVDARVAFPSPCGEKVGINLVTSPSVVVSA